MSINVIVPTILIASVSYVQPVFEASYTEPVVSNTSYVQPVFSANYLQIQVAAEVTMPDVLAVDVVTPVDLVTLSTEKSTFDIAITSDKLLKNLQKPLTDEYTLADSFSKSVIFNRIFAEFLSSADAAVFISMLAKADSMSVADAKVLNFSKNLADVSSIVDMMDGNIEYNLFKVLAEFSTLSEAQIIDFTTQKADNITTTSNGVLAMQDYCDITYFLEDYVGISRTFT